MKNIIISLLLLVVFAACDTEQRKEEATSNMDTAEHKKTEATEKTESTNSDAQLISDEDLEAFENVNADLSDQIIDAYLKIKDALVNTNGEVAKKTADSVLKELKEHEGEAVSMIRKDISHISITSSVEHQREHFKNLSAHVYALVKSTEANDQTLYKQYCPMAFDNTGAYWLSSSEEIKNPYFGDKMLNCGKVQETIEG